jgi:hypothetical protein
MHSDAQKHGAGGFGMTDLSYDSHFQKKVTIKEYWPVKRKVSFGSQQKITDQSDLVFRHQHRRMTDAG